MYKRQVIIGAKDGKLQVEQENQCRGFGFGRRTLDAALATNSEPTVANGFKIVHDCRQTGEYATKYSNIYDLKSGDIFLYPLSERDGEVKFNLAAELKKGGHYYDMPQIKEQLAQAPRPLLLNMKPVSYTHLPSAFSLQPFLKMTAPNHSWRKFKNCLLYTSRCV